MAFIYVTTSCERATAATPHERLAALETHRGWGGGGEGVTSYAHI